MPNRPPNELILIMFAATVCTAIVVSAVGLVVVEVVSPSVDTSAATTGVGSVLQTLVGVLVGYLAGRGRRDQNGSS